MAASDDASARSEKSLPGLDPGWAPVFEQNVRKIEES
jgi:hypothetical protein